MSYLTVITLAYVTYQDIRGVRSFEDHTIIAIKAPAETRLEVPDPKEVCNNLVSCSKFMN